MPVILLDRLPLPNLRVYTSVSVVALSVCVYFATQVIKDPNWNSENNAAGAEESNSGGGAAATLLLDPSNNSNNNGSYTTGRSMSQYVSEIFSMMIREPICVWTMINMAFCWLILIGTAIQKLVFGDLRVSEQQHLKDKFWNFVFYKFIFVFGIVNVQYIDEVLLWCSWFSLLGFLHLLSQLSKDRFEYLSFSPTTPLWSHVKLLALLGAIFALSGFMLLVSVFVGFFGGFNTFAFLSAEVVLLSIRTLHVILRYALHLYDMRQEGGGTSNVQSSEAAAAASSESSEENKGWEKRGPVAYYIELCFELTALTIDFVHHLHMLVWSNIFLSMASLVICMQLRYLFHEIQRRYKKHRNYLWVRNHLEQNYPMASSEELAENSDNCAICWEKMESARKLPCTHLFHNACLLSWLEQDTSCPTCRLALNIQNPSAVVADPPELHHHHQAETAPQHQRLQLNHFFHFDGSRYVSWLPSFSVEVSHAQLMRTSENAPASNSQLDAMARQVQQLFPHIPISSIIGDLRVTRSVELTIENVLDGRLVVPAMYHREPEIVETLQQQQQHQVTSESGETAGGVGKEVLKDWEEFNTEETETDGSSLGSRFSKSSSEREKILYRRKENLIQTARKRYIEKQKAAAAASIVNASSTSEILQS